MPLFMKGGSQAVTFTKAYLQSGNLILRDTVKILAFNYLPGQAISHGVNDFLRMTLPQLQFKNPAVQILTMQNLAPTPFINCYLDADGRRELLIDCSHRKRVEIQDHMRKILCKTSDEVAEENLRRQVVRNPANFGYGCKRHCICEVFGQVPCSSARTKQRRYVELRKAAAEAAATAAKAAEIGGVGEGSTEAFPSSPSSDEPSQAATPESQQVAAAEAAATAAAAVATTAAAVAAEERPLAEFEHSVSRLLELLTSVESLTEQGAELPECRNTAESLSSQAAESARQLDAWFRQRRFVFLQNALLSGAGNFSDDRLASLREEVARKEDLIRSAERQLRDSRNQLASLIDRRGQRRDEETPNLSYTMH